MPILFVLFGTTLLHSPLGSHLTFKTFLTGLFGAVCAGVAYLALRSASARHSPSFVVWVFSAVTALATIFVPSERWAFPSGILLVYALCIGTLGLLGQLFLTRSFLYLSAGTASTLMLSGVLWGGLAEGVILQWHPSRGALVSYGLVILGLHFLFRTKEPPSEVEALTAN